MDKKFITGLVSGLALGAVLSLVLMPESGRKVADKVREKAKEVSRRIREKREEFSEIADEAEEFFNSMVEREKLTQAQAHELTKMLNKFVKTK